MSDLETNDSNKNVVQKKLEKFSYSKLSTYEGCGWKFKLIYKDKHFIPSDSIANEFGTLMHYVEETIANDIIANDGEPNFMIDDEKYIDLFINADIHTDTENVLGVRKLKEKYPDDFYVADKSGMNYEQKANDYLNYGIYRLRDFLAKNRNISLVGVEVPFKLKFNENYEFHGFIDRVMKDNDTGEYIIEDIKSWWTIKNHDTVTPLQFVFYSLAAQELYNINENQISCYYDLPLEKSRFAAGTKGFIKRGLKKINILLEKIEKEEFEPNASTLCHWCIFSRNYIKPQPDEAKNLCPYYCKYTKDNKSYDHEFEWMGIKNHEAILQEFINKYARLENSKKPIEIKPKDLNLLPIEEGRIFLIRRR